jgi:hypothetical protein
VDKEVKMKLIDLRMRAKAQIAMYAHLDKHTKISYKNRIDRLLDLINEIDRKLDEK